MSRVEGRAPVAHDRQCRHQPVQGAELKPVLRRKRVDVIGGLEAAATGHVLDDDRGRAGNVAAEMSADETCPDGISAGRSDVGNEFDLFAVVKLVLRRRAREIEQQGGYPDREDGGFETSSRSLESMYMIILGVLECKSLVMPQRTSSVANADATADINAVLPRME